MMSEDQRVAEHEGASAAEQGESPEVKTAAEAVRRAQEELEKARETYQSIRRQATERVERLRESTVGDVLEGSLDAVRKHPALGVGIAALIGFFLGRLFRR